MLATNVRVVDHRRGHQGLSSGNAYEVTDLMRKWEVEEITSEQMIGQILLHMQTLTDKVQELERQVEKGK